jgi:hypothetical protein
MTDREKLIQIIDSSRTYVANKENLTEDLIENGVTFQKWIPVSERLPEKQHDWVLVACKLHPEGFYGVPHIGELRNGVWWCDCYEVP